jgi:phosphoglycolate phosphatase-like HAD superfamily hydrolase
MLKDHQRILLFDIDGTLIDPAGEGSVCMKRALEDVCGEAGPIESYDMSGKTDWQITADLMAMVGLSPDEIDAKRQAVFGAYVRHVNAAAPLFEMRILPGVHALLKALASDSHFMLGLVTGNVREAVPYKLQAVGIDPSLFRFGAFGSEHKDRRLLPSLALHRLSQLLGEAPRAEQVLVIGDTPKDIECARHAGLKVMCVATGCYGFEEMDSFSPDYLLKDLSETDQVLEILSNF